MSSIVYQTNPSTGVKYAYESISYWDKEKKPHAPNAGISDVLTLKPERSSRVQENGKTMLHLKGLIQKTAGFSRMSWRKKTQK